MTTEETLSNMQSTPRFECDIPREHWFPPTPSKLTKKPVQTDWRALGMTTIIAAAFVATVQIMHQQQSPPAFHVEPAAPAAPAARLAPTPAPDPIVLPVPARLPPEVRRAQLVDLPIGSTQFAMMPDGHPLFVTYRGKVASFDQLPRHPQWSDMYWVTDSGHAWVWSLPSNFNAPAWVDP